MLAIRWKFRVQDSQPFIYTIHIILCCLFAFLRQRPQCLPKYLHTIYLACSVIQQKSCPFLLCCENFKSRKQKFILYRRIKSRLHTYDKHLNVLQEIICCIVCEIHETHKYTLWITSRVYKYCNILCKLDLILRKNLLHCYTWSLRFRGAEIVHFGK